MVMRLGGLLATAALLALASNGSAADNGGTARVDQARLEAAASDADNWLTYGRTYAEQRFSELAHVNDGNIGELRLAWAVGAGHQRVGRKRPRSLSTGSCTPAPPGRR